MTENLGRKTTLTVALLLAALAMIFGPLLLGKKPFRLGLDLQGGTRLVYRFDFQKALEQQQLSAVDMTRKDELLNEFRTIIHERIDPRGTMELSLRKQGEDQLVIEVPGAAEFGATVVTAKLGAPLSPSDSSLSLSADQGQSIKSFGITGGVVRIGGEKILYAGRVGSVLNGLKRGMEGTSAAAHEAGAAVELLSSDELQRRIENVGDMQFLLAAGPEHVRAMGGDLAAEQKKLDDWRKANPDLSVDEFNRLAPDKGGPLAGLKWYPHRVKGSEAEVPYAQRAMVPLYQPKPTDASAPANAWEFTGGSLQSVGMSSDNLGYPAVSFEMAPEKKIAFGDFTEAHINDGMAIVLNGEIATLANIKSRLPGSGIIEGGAGGFSQQEVKDLITVLRSGSLRVKPELIDKARVGASLGEDYIRTSMLSAGVATLLVVLFMVFFYRKLGWYSVLGFVANILLLAGVMALWGATLTLPGIAGVVLTIGMAVDGNILIYERLREELRRGLKLPQAAKAAFERAGVTIIDSNLTTLIAGVILLWAGTGPIRGFATTLSVGILTTLFTVIVLTELLVAYDLKRSAPAYRLREYIKEPKIDFMSAVKVAFGTTWLVIAVGLAIFWSLPEREKYGIDFLGGYAVTVRTQDPQGVDEVRKLISTVPGEVGKSAEVKAINDTEAAPGKYRAFRITAKIGAEGAEGEAATVGAQAAEVEIKKALSSVLQRGPVEITLSEADGALKAQGEVYFETGHQQADVQAALAETGLEAPTLAPHPDHPDAFTFQAKAPAGATVDDLKSRIALRFENHKDSAGAPYRLLTAVPESSMIGASVGSDLRDKAIRAVILSLFATMLYLRFRFAEWSYGVAVVASLVHDVLMTLAAIAVARRFDLVQAEIDLSMIAAFLTIIGYSQNDTIVTFDRVRELRPRSNKPLRQVLNDAINQTLGRTILTTSTVFLTVVVLFLFSYGTRNVIEGFTFALMVGVLSGAFSTVYIAGPVFLWLEKWSERRHKKLGAPVAGAEPAS